MAPSNGSQLFRDQLTSFHEHLKKSKRVLAVLGAGLSASSGLPTFRGAGGLWRTHDATSIATPEAFIADPGLVWQFYSYRRHMALNVQPNPAHYALAELARRMPDFLTLTQNVDGLSPRAGHPKDQLVLLHGSLFNVRCSDEQCGHTEVNYVDPIVPALAIPTDGKDPTTYEARQEPTDQLGAKERPKDLDISDINVPLPSLSSHDLPACPKCKRHILRPGVVWFGEALSDDVLDRAQEFMDDEKGIDLVLVIGTSSKVFPAAGYAAEAKAKGAKVCVVNMEADSLRSWYEVDWSFQGDAAQLLPEMFKPIIDATDSP